MHVYFMGVGGTAMGQAARLFREAGHRVSGSDTALYPPMSDVLRESGIEALPGYDARRLERLAPDLVVVGNAQSRGNPEVEWLLDTRALPYTSLPQALGEYVLARRRPVVVSGTHGKTTTTAMAAHLLDLAGCGAGWLIGGAPLTPAHGSRLGTPGAPFVIEGDEYDSAFFDKRSKFVHYSPRVALVNNVEFDHADIFHDLKDYRRAFQHFLRLVPSTGAIVANGDDPELVTLLDVSFTRVWRVGTGPGCDVRIAGFTHGTDGATFELLVRGRPWANVRIGLQGLFNARNAAMAAWGAALALDPEEPTRFDPTPGLASFRCVRRRQQTLLETPKHVIVEDFGHHPTALRETLAAVRVRYPKRDVWAAFEPRSNTARTRVLQAQFRDALATADRVFLGAVSRATLLGAEERLDTAALAQQLREQGIEAEAASCNVELLERLARALEGAPRPVLLILFSNGSFDGIPRTLAARFGS